MTERAKRGRTPVQQMAEQPVEEAPKEVSKPKKPNPTLEAARLASKNQKLHTEVLNPPKWRDLRGRDFSNANMREMFNTGILQNFDFTGANLENADFTGMIAQGCKFNDSKLAGAIFYDADLRWSDFTGAEFDEALFGYVDEQGNVIRRANLKETYGGLI